MFRRLALVFVCWLAAGSVFAADKADKKDKKYEATWESLDRRACPDWFRDAKFGIFIHWGVYSVPAWAPKGNYAEWYWSSLGNKPGATWKFHVKTYGENFLYPDFAPRFTAEMFDADQWATLFQRAGAKYVVLTSKHHDGYCLWPSAHATKAWGRPWTSADVGPKRDLCGDLGDAVRAKGMKMGFYFSLYEWFNPLYRQDVSKYVDQHMLPQLKDLVTGYRPSLIFTDGEWDHPSDTWKSREFLAWLFNDGPNAKEVVVNDRWGKDCRSAHGTYFTTEYGEVGGNKRLPAGRVWEENRGIGASFGYNRNETIDEYRSGPDLIRLLIDTVARGGNLLLDVGPTADGRIPVVMQDRLVQIGEWLKINGAAIYGTRAGPLQKLAWGRSTAKGNKVYLHVFDWPANGRLETPALSKPVSQAYLLTDPRTPLRVEGTGRTLTIHVPASAVHAAATVVVLELRQ